MKVQHVNASALVVRWARPEVTYHPPILHFLVSYSWTSHDDSYEETHLTDPRHRLVSLGRADRCPLGTEGGDWPCLMSFRDLRGRVEAGLWFCVWSFHPSTCFFICFSSDISATQMILHHKNKIFQKFNNSLQKKIVWTKRAAIASLKKRMWRRGAHVNISACVSLMRRVS